MPRRGRQGIAFRTHSPPDHGVFAEISFEAKFAVVYLALGMMWLYLDHSVFLNQSTVLKDALYIVTSTLVLFWIFKKGIKKIRSSEKALAESEERLASILETAASGIFVLNGRGEVTFVNRSAEIILGIPQDLIIGEKYNTPRIRAMTLDGRHLPEVERPYARVLATGKPVHNFEYLIERPDGVRAVLSVNAAAFWDETGRVAGVVVSATDVTERKRLEELNLRKLSMAVEQSPVAVAITDRRGLIEYVNPSYSRMTGYSAAEAARMPDVCPTGESPEASEQIARAVAAGTGWAGTFRNRRKDGGFYWESASLSPIRDNEGSVSNFLWLRSDITERKRSEEELRESEERFRQMFEQNEESVILFRAGSAAILDANAAALTLYGFDLEEFLGGRPGFFVAPEERAGFIDRVSGIAEGGVIQIDRASHVRKDGRRIIVSVRGKCMKFPGGAVFYCSFRDITERIRMEEEAKVRQAQLIHASRIASLGMLVSGVAHEINNPNNLVMFNAPIVRDAWRDIVPLLDRCRQDEGDFLAGGLPYSEMRDALPRLLQGIGDASRRIKNIVENLKGFAAQDRSSLDCAVNVNAFTKMAVDLLQPEIARRAIRFEALYDGSLPGIRGCAQQLEQVVLNLLMNALQAVTDPSGRVRLVTRMNGETGCAEIRVEDDGIGIPEEILRRIGEPFVTTKSGQGGLGLGLSISSSIVKAHGGTMTFHSAIGDGTVVIMSLPVASDAPAVHAAATA